MSIDVLARQLDSEIGRQHSFRTIIAEYAIEDEIACRLAVMRILPEPAHRRQIGGIRNDLARDRVGVAEIPQRQRYSPGARRLLSLMNNSFAAIRKMECCE